MKRLQVIWLSLLVFLWPTPSEAGTLRGHIDKRDTTVSPAAYAMAYVAGLRTGATADENGDFVLSLPESCNGKTLRVEYSLIGYTTLEKDVDIPAGGQEVTDRVVLDFAPIMLAASYVTADGKDPAEYILSMVWKTADKNKKKVKNYTADVVYTLGTHELPVVTGVLPGFTLMMGKIAAGFMGVGPLVDYCTRHDDLKATVSLTRVVTNGARKDSNHQILEISPDNVPKNVQNNIKSVFGKIDLYGMLYGSNNAWGRKFTRRSTFVLEGSYNYGDYIVDVLHWKDPNTDATATIHVIEDLWQILKVQVGRQEEAVLCEARDYGGGIFMPVSFVIKPALTRIKVKDIPMAIERCKAEIKDKGTRKRAIKLLEGYQARGEDFDPYILARYNVRYGTN